MAGEKDTTIEVSWCRRLLENAEQDYMSMINSLLIENKQLEELLALMAQHLDNLASNFVGRDLDGPEAAAAARQAASEQLGPRLEELFEQRSELNTLRQERALLQKQLCEEKMETQDLQRKLETALEEASASVLSERRSEDEDEASLSSRLHAAEASRAQEARSRELTEVRCALIERRCCDAVARLEAELREVRAQAASTPCFKSENGSVRDGLESVNHTPLREQVQALTEQMDFERELHDRRRALLERYSSTEKSMAPAVGIKAVAEGPREISALRVAAESPRSVASEDEDYNWEGYLERPAEGGEFEKVFVEIRSGKLRVLRSRTSQSLLNEYSLSAMTEPAALLKTCPRSFQVSLAEPSRFRCVSERRAMQWVEAVNGAWRHAASRGRTYTQTQEAA
ncbi:unnamed protein product [Symbiodinium natans]|uniref:PH domain-containing protein n=1 Tax=Symbiodinium natans TaxID=878477 RepID=A0A812KAK1_9DINO|nr:unnamed protein product [Symbiodinium natans]